MIIAIDERSVDRCAAFTTEHYCDNELSTYRAHFYRAGNIVLGYGSRSISPTYLMAFHL
jgi:hypothetical protein